MLSFMGVLLKLFLLSVILAILVFITGCSSVEQIGEQHEQEQPVKYVIEDYVSPAAEAEETEMVIEPKDLKIDVYRASGAGGQHVNKTESAVRITHIPTGFVVSCQDERSQHKNKTKAMRVLRARLFDAMEQKRAKEIAKERKAQVGSGDRSGKIRTYNFPDQRVTDHRIGLTLHELDDILNGHLDGLVQALEQHERERKLADTAS